MRIPDLIVRSATEQDRQSLANLIHFEVYVHRHLDWRLPIDWVGKNPCLVSERSNHLLAALICPPDPPEAAWIRLFVVSQDMPLEEGWKLLWSKALEQLNKMSCPLIAGIALRSWFQGLLEQSGFVQIQDIVSLNWELSKSVPINVKPDVLIRPMLDSDLPSVHALDVSAFGLLWRISPDTLLSAYQQACVATVVEVDEKIVGYQISTAGPMGGHLARLAVHPAYQRKGIGTALVNDVLHKFERRGAVRVTVNTQRDNITSLSLYEKTGFKPTGEVFPVYQYNWMM